MSSVLCVVHLLTGVEMSRVTVCIGLGVDISTTNSPFFNSILPEINRFCDKYLQLDLKMYRFRSTSLLHKRDFVRDFV